MSRIEIAILMPCGGIASGYLAPPLNGPGDNTLNLLFIESISLFKHANESSGQRLKNDKLEPIYSDA